MDKITSLEDSIFKQKVAEVGIGKALVYFFDSLTKEVISKLTFDQWKEILTSVYSTSDLHNYALDKMSKLAENLKQWKEVHYRADLGSDLRKLALQKVREFVVKK